MLTRAIHIDLAVHKAIEAAKRSFEESENDVLRRLLHLPTDGAAPPEGSARSESRVVWSWKGVSLPEGTELRMTYKGIEVPGRVHEGQWEVAGQRLKSPSDAAKVAVESRHGREVSLNGWNYWQFRRPGETRWRPIHSLRNE